MTNTKNTKRALLSSVLALFLCFAMLLGTTYAWFTDSVTSANNIITAGNLNIELYHSDDKVKEAKVGTTTTLFDDVVLWEPGAVVYETFKIANEGNLALKYQLAVNVTNASRNANGGTLADVLKVGVIEGGAKTATREEMIGEVKSESWTSLESFTLSGALEKEESDTYTVVIYWQPSEIDNAYNMKDGEPALTIDIGVNLYATQQMSEKDSFENNNYDEYAGLPWDGSVSKVPEEVDNVITITNASELAAFAAAVNNGNTYSGKTVKLAADINLNNKPWTPIGQTGSTTFAGIFDGNGKTLYNLNIDNTANTSEHGAAGLFGWIEQHSGSNSIKNLTIDGVTINSHRYSGAVAGWVNIPVTNCVVKNVTINCSYYNDDTDGTKVGALVGYADNKSALTGNTVENAVLNAYGDVGGLAGIAQTTVSVDGNTVKNVHINYASTVKSEPGALASTRVTPVYGTNTTENVTFVKSVIVSTADALAAALKSTDKVIVITLANDIAIDIGTGWKMGGAGTESITIKGATPATVLTLSSTYRSYFNLANPDGTLYLQDLKLTNTHNGTHFFDYTTHFNCDVVATNVAFQKAPLTSAVTAEFNNCTFAEPVASYSLWIMAGSNVTVDGASFNATRGIKIADEDTTDAVTTLTVKDAKFNTTEKAAIVVASDMGANIKLSNVNIENTIDPVHEVWVDEDYAASDDAVKVTDGEKIYEGYVVSNGLYIDENKEYYVFNAEGLATLNNMMVDKTAGKNIVVNLSADIDFSGKTWVTVDSHADTTFTLKEINGNGHTISNLTVNGQAMFSRFAGTGDVVIKDITFDGATINSNGTINTSILTVQTYQNVLLDNVDVKNSTISGGYKVAPLIATVYNENESTITATLKNCDVEKVTVIATVYDFCTTGLVAYVSANDNDKIEFENCTVTNVVLKAPDDAYKAHAAVYTTGSGSLYNEVEGVTVTNVTFETT